MIPQTCELIAKDLQRKSKTINVLFEDGQYMHDGEIKVGTKVFALWKNDLYIRPYFATVTDVILGNPTKYRLVYADGDIGEETIDGIEKIYEGMNIINNGKTIKFEGYDKMNLVKFRPDCLYKLFIKKRKDGTDIKEATAEKKIRI